VSHDTRYGAVALLGLVGLFISLYLLLYDLGFYGVLLCGSGSCETVQASKWAIFLGVPVPAWGVAWYGLVMATALRLRAAGEDARTAGRLLAVLSVGGVAFSAYLTSLELFVLHAICFWCVASAVIAVAIFLVTAPWRRRGERLAG